MGKAARILGLVFVLFQVCAIGAWGADSVSEPLKTLEALELAGRVKSIREEHFEAVPKGEGFTAGTPMSWFVSIFADISFFPQMNEEEDGADLEGLSAEAHFDEKGRPLFYKNAMGDDIGTRTTTFVWDGQGKLLKEETGKDGPVITYKYDRDGKLIEGIAEADGLRYWRAVMEYDAARNPVRILHYAYDGEKENLSLSVTRKYDDKNRVVWESVRMADNEIGYEDEFLYDDAGRLAERRSVDAGGNENATGSVYRIRYDSQGRRLEESYDSLDGKTVYVRQLRSYDDQGRIVAHEESYDEGRVVRNAKYSYDVKGHLAKIDHGAAWETYLCDEQGNWTERVMHVEEGLDVLTRRTLEYWP